MTQLVSILCLGCSLEPSVKEIFHLILYAEFLSLPSFQSCHFVKTFFRGCGDLKTLQLEYKCIHSPLWLLCSQQVMASQKWCKQQFHPSPCDIQSELWQRLWMNWDFNSKRQLQVLLILGVVTNSDCFDWLRLEIFFSGWSYPCLCAYIWQESVMAVKAITHWSNWKSNKTEGYWTVWSIRSGTHTDTHSRATSKEKTVKKVPPNSLKKVRYIFHVTITVLYVTITILVF